MREACGIIHDGSVSLGLATVPDAHECAVGGHDESSPPSIGDKQGRVHVALDARFLAHAALRGCDRYTVGLATALAEKGLRVTLFHERGAPPRASHFFRGLGSIRMVAVSGREGAYWEQVALPRAIERCEVDVYHAPAERGVPLGARTPTVLAMHSATIESYAALIEQGKLPGRLEDYVGAQTLSGWRRQYLRAELRWADHIVTPSDYAKKEIVDFLRVPSSRVTTTPLAADDIFRQPEKSESDRLARLAVRKPYLLYVGGYEAHKNPNGVLDVYERVARRHNDLSLVLVGTGQPSASLRDRATSLGASCLSDLGEDLVTLYDRAELFISMSWRETFGLPALEAMSRGTPAITSAWGASPEVVAGGGYQVDPRDPDEAALVVERALQNRAALSSLARAQASKFTWSATADATIAVYETVLRERRRRPRRLRRWWSSLRPITT